MNDMATAPGFKKSTTILGTMKRVGRDDLDGDEMPVKFNKWKT